MRIRFSRAARTELRVAARYYEDEAEGLGLAFQQEVRAAAGLLTDQPEAGRVVEDAPGDPPVRQFRVRRFPYILFYFVDAGIPEVVVLAVAHARREPLYWMSRR